MKDISLISKKQKEQGLSRSKSVKKKKGGASKGMKVAIAIAVLVVLAGLGSFIWGQMLENEAQALEEEKKAVIAERDAQLESRVNTLSSLINAYEALLKQHKNWSRIFTIIENRTVPTVTFHLFEGEYSQGSFLLEGTAPNYNAVAQQIRAFEETEQFIAVGTDQVGLNDEGDVAFNLSVSFKQAAAVGAPEIQ